MQNPLEYTSHCTPSVNKEEVMNLAVPSDFTHDQLPEGVQPSPYYRGITFTYDDVCRMIGRVGRRNTRVTILGNETQVFKFSSEAGQPLRFEVHRTTYDYAVAIWMNCALIEVRQKHMGPIRCIMWPTTTAELQVALQTILNDTAKHTSVARAANVSLTAASPAAPPQPAPERWRRYYS